MHTVYLLAGSNVGDRVAWLEMAADACTELAGAVMRVSQVYETAPWGLTAQPAFLNQALELHTSLTAESLLDAIRNIEYHAGRARDIPWGPRTLDIDVLLFDDAVVETPELQIPHPRMHLRRFVLAPLAEIAGEVVHPVLKKTISTLLDECPDQSEVGILAGT